MKLQLNFLKTALILAIVVGNISHAFSQITITEGIITDRFNQKYREVLYETNLDISGQLQAIMEGVGSNQVWDFSDLNYVDSTVIIYEIFNIDANDPYAMNPNLARSNFIHKLTLYPVQGGLQDTSCQFLYSTLESGEWSVNGSVSHIDLDGIVDTLLQWFAPPVVQAQFPVTMNSEWHSTSNLTQMFMGMEFISSEMIDSNKVVGYGTLITPAGSQEALRINNKQIDTPVGFPFVDESNSIDFVTVDEAISASIVVEDGRAFYATKKNLGGTTSVLDLPELSIEFGNIFPNPVIDDLIVPLSTSENIDINIFVRDMSGKIIVSVSNIKLVKGYQQIKVNTSPLTSGVYVVEIRHRNQVQSRKFTKIN